MFDLIKKAVKSKFGKPEPEVPAREYMRLKLEVEEVCALHAMDFFELKKMSIMDRDILLGEEDADKVNGHFRRMDLLWPLLPPEQKEFHNSSYKEISYQEIAQDNLEKEYIRLNDEIEEEVGRIGLRYDQYALMSGERRNLLLGEDLAKLVKQKYNRAGELWQQFTPEQKDRNILKSFGRIY